MRNAEKRSDVRVTPGLFDDTVARIHQYQCQVGGRGAGDHVAGVLHVAGRVCDDELPSVCREEAVRHIDGDPLLAFVFQTIGKVRQLQVTDSLFLRDLLQIIDLILINRLGVK